MTIDRDWVLIGEAKAAVTRCTHIIGADMANAILKGLDVREVNTDAEGE